MNGVGQIIEIPKNSSKYAINSNTFSSLQEKVVRLSQRYDYNLFDGFLVGEHQGLKDFVLGQRKGIHIGGKKEPLYVIGFNEDKNQLFVGAGKDHPGLWTEVLRFPFNQILWKIDPMCIQFHKTTEGLAVEIKTSISEGKLVGKLCVIQDFIYIKLNQNMAIQIYNEPIQILYQNNLIIETI